MSDSQNYYYMRLKENFFDSDEIVILESMEEGYLYSNILLKLYLKSLKRNGKLTLNETIPYNVEILAKVTRHDIDTMRAALEIFEGLGLIEKLNNGIIYITNIQNFIGKSSTEADRKRIYREQIEKDKCPEKSKDKYPEKSKDKCPDKSTPEIDIEIEKEIEKEIKDKKNNIVSADAQPTDILYPVNSCEMQTVETIIHSCLEQFPGSKVPDIYKAKAKWCDEVSRMKKIDNRTEDEIKQALHFAINDPFWKSNIRSTKKLREKFDTLIIQSRQKKTGSKQSPGEFIDQLKEWSERENDDRGIF